MNKLATILTGAALLLTLACGGGGGGGTPAIPAKALAYAFTPDSGTWRLEQDASDPSTTTTHLVFKLYAPSAPASLSGNGFTATLAVNPGRAAWSTVDGTSYALQTLVPTPVALPGVWLAKRSADGGTLHILLGQPLGSALLDYSSHALATVAMDLADGATVGNAGLTVTQAGALLGTSAAPPAAVTVSCGTLSAQ